MPLAIMVVETRMSIFPSLKSPIMFFILFLSKEPCKKTTVNEGISEARRPQRETILLTELSTIILNFSKPQDLEIGPLINERHNNIINESIICIEKTISALLASETSDIVAELLHQFINTFNNISTPVNRKDIINNIFSNFCVGK